MLKRLYVHNFRSLQNFELNLSGLKSALLLGKNGAGKTSIFDVMHIFQQLAQGVSQIKYLITKNDFAFGDLRKCIKMELEVTLDSKDFFYTLEIEMPEDPREPIIKSEQLKCQHEVILDRSGGRTLLNNSAEFSLDWHHFGLPLISVRNEQEPIALFREWLKELIVLSPISQSFAGTTQGEHTYLDRQGVYVLDWLRELLAETPNLYAEINDFLKYRLPDFSLFKFNTIGAEEKEWVVEFKNHSKKKMELKFSQLSDGEKIFILASGLVARMSSGKPFLCLWDEPDHYVSLAELSHFILSCRKAAETKEGQVQIVFSTHNAQVIQEFSEHNIFVLSRASHLDPTRCLKAEDKNYISPTLVEAFENGEFE